MTKFQQVDRSATIFWSFDTPTASKWKVCTCYCIHLPFVLLLFPLGSMPADVRWLGWISTGHIKSPKAWFELLQFYDLLTFAIHVIAFISKVCASWWGEVAGLDLDCGGGHFKSPKAWFEVLQFYDLLTHQQHPNEKSTFTIVFICHSCYRFCL